MFKNRVNRSIFLGLLFTAGCIYTAVSVFEVSTETLLDSLISILVLTFVIILLAVLPVLVRAAFMRFKKK